MKLIAFDLGTKTGCAIGDSRDRPFLHTENLGQPGKQHGARLTQAIQMTMRLIKQHEPDLIAIEMPIAAGPKGAAERVQLAMGFRASVMIACHLKHVRFVEYPVQSIRKHFVGRGDLKRTQAKAEVMARCKLLGWHAQTDDQSDAAAVWDYARCLNTKLSTPPPNGLFDERDQPVQSG